VLFTGALLRMLLWLHPALGTSWGCVIEGMLSMGQLLFSIAEEKSS